jgi:hypothetical protein
MTGRCLVVTVVLFVALGGTTAHARSSPVADQCRSKEGPDPALAHVPHPMRPEVSQTWWIAGSDLRLLAVVAGAGVLCGLGIALRRRERLNI